MTTPDPWSQWRRPGPTAAQRRQDVWLALAVLAGAAAVTVLVRSMGAFVHDETISTLVEQLLWGAGISLPLAVRRRYPLTVLLVVSAVFIAGQARHVADNLVPSIALFTAIYTAGAWSRDRVRARVARIGVVVGMFGWLGFSLVRELLEPVGPFENAVGPLDPVLASVLYGVAFNVLFFLSAYHFGNTAWLSARRKEELEHRAEELRRSQEQNMRGAVVAERVRIARDLHDVVAHHVSVMGVQAGAARRVLDRDLDLARSTLQTVEDTARTAIGELRGLLGVLRADPAEEPGPEEAAPADEVLGAQTSSPGLDQLPELAAMARSAGLEVVHGVYGEPRPVPEGVALSVYRIVQEALTNVVKHAGAAGADVRVRFLEQSLEVEVTDDGRGVTSGSGGFGLVGMRERVAVHGGALEAGPRRGGGYRVLARFPA
ncbi:sensor histidine kinase [Saccharothrix variisporea]|uniref:histidine kinase n=1 Tax=Saccharothrix variisporea TaxID=543527 RepID=A0A495X285_9PSEU|nr:sensor histidine kinase [Saccharothrix variisporea]RKT67997.1 signal transduction histidine kinase [Saccharothrix variisporea]